MKAYGLVDDQKVKDTHIISDSDNIHLFQKRLSINQSFFIIVILNLLIFISYFLIFDLII